MVGKRSFECTLAHIVHPVWLAHEAGAVSKVFVRHRFRKVTTGLTRLVIWSYSFRRTNSEYLPMASLPLFGETDSRPKLVGIARIAADGESLREGHNVEYFTLGTRSLLSRVVSGRNLPFTWAINPYRGCEFACKYCYARYTHEFMELRDGVDFERKIFVKQQVAELLRSELKKVKRGEEIAIGTATDPYQPAERRFEVTRTILEELAKHSGLEI